MSVASFLLGPKLYWQKNGRELLHCLLYTSGIHPIYPNLHNLHATAYLSSDSGKSGEFQQCLFDTFNRYFGITDEDVFDDVVKRKLETKGLYLKGTLAHEIVSDAQFYDYENIGINLKEAKGRCV